MEKKEYTQPEVKIISIQNTSIICTSNDRERYIRTNDDPWDEEYD